MGGGIGADLATLTFRRDGSKALRGRLVPGERARLQVELDRFRACRLVQPTEAYRAVAFVRGTRGAWREYVLAEFVNGAMVVSEPEFRIPAAARIEVRFFVFSGADCFEEDPVDDDPYWFPVNVPVEGATIEFGPTGGPLVTGELGPGRAVTVVYPLERLPNCRFAGEGVPGWETEVIWRVNQITSSVALTAIEEPDVRLETPAGIDIPINGDSLELRFRNRDETGCETLEPADGQWFRFEF